MITSLRFQNFRSFRDTTLPLGNFTLLVGANGSGKSTAMEAFRFLAGRELTDYDKYLSANLRNDDRAKISVEIKYMTASGQVVTKREIKQLSPNMRNQSLPGSRGLGHEMLPKDLKSFRVFSFNSDFIAEPVITSPNAQLLENGANLAAVLDSLRDSHPEKFEQLNEELHRWLPEFDRILFRTPADGKKTFMVRTSNGAIAFEPHELSQGVLFSLAFLTLAYLPSPPSIICFEEPDRGIHPRLLKDIQDAMYRLAFPSEYGEKRNPVQVIATTHSPYLVDLYKDHPEQIVIVHKDENGSHFERISDKPHISEILDGAPLGEIWYSGVLGGVPSTS